jgi:hypothetical protein
VRLPKKKQIGGGEKSAIGDSERKRSDGNGGWRVNERKTNVFAQTSNAIKRLSLLGG